MSSMSRPDRSRRKDGGDSPPPSPGTVTAIQTQAHDPERVSVFIDGAFAFGLGREVADLAGLAVGDDLDQERLRDLLARETRHRALSTALVFLAHRPRSEGEIRTRLRRDDHDAETIEATLVRLREWRYVDDSDFARRWVENRDEHRPRGTRLLATELRQKGVDPDIIAEAIDDVGIDEEAGALDLARKRSRQLTGLEPAVRERRLSGFLARRGYGYDIIRRVLETLADEVELEDSGEDMSGLEPGAPHASGS
jgi:regulatory protein